MTWLYIGIAVYIIGLLVVGFIAGRDAWQHGNSDILPSRRKQPHDTAYAWSQAFGFGLFWPLLAVASGILGLCFAVAWPFKTNAAKRLAGKLWN